MVLVQGNEIAVGMLVAYSGVIAFFPILRYVIGLKHWKDFSVLSIGLSAYFWVNVFNHWYLGLLSWSGVFILTMLAMTFVREKLYKANLHFFAKLALSSQAGLISYLISIYLLQLLFGVNLLNWVYIGLAGLTLVAGAETLVYLQLKKGPVEALRRSVISVVSALLVGILFRWRSLLVFLYLHQELLIIFMGVTVIVSTWRYLNISDYVRFLRILDKHD